MVDASFSSPGGESSMKEGDEENVLPNSNQKQLPSHSSPKDQTNSEREEDTALVLLGLDVNNVNRKTNEGAKHCDGNSQKNGKRLRGSGDSPLPPVETRGELLHPKKRPDRKHADDEDDGCIKEVVQKCQEALNALLEKNEAKKSTPDSNKDLPPTETKTVGDCGWKEVGAFDSKEKAYAKAMEYFARKKTRCLGGKTLVGKRYYYTYRCAEHLEDKVECPTRVRIRWNKATKFKYAVGVTDSEKCKDTYKTQGNKKIKLIEAGKVKDQNGEAAEGVHQRMYTKDGRQRGLNGEAKLQIIEEMKLKDKLTSTQLMGILEKKKLDHGVSEKQIKVS